jgi:hypothetical protein
MGGIISIHVTLEALEVQSLQVCMEGQSCQLILTHLASILDARVCKRTPNKNSTKQIHTSFPLKGQNF